jgi:hypothetical protein
MKAWIRRFIEMGQSVVKFNAIHPDTEAGYITAASALEALLIRALKLVTAQREGQIDRHAASERKIALRTTMLARHIPHLASAGKLAAKVEHELASAFVFRPSGDSFLAFSTTARSMAAAADAHKEVLIKYGLAESVLEEFKVLLDEFDAAVTLGVTGRNAHKGATAELDDVGRQIAQTVRVMDARNRQRFADDGELLGAWISASTVLGTPRGDSAAAGSSGTTTPPQDPTVPAPTPGDVRPAA